MESWPTSGFTPLDPLPIGWGSVIRCRRASRSPGSDSRCTTGARCSCRPCSCSSAAARPAPTSSACDPRPRCSVRCRRTRRCTGRSGRSGPRSSRSCGRRWPKCGPRCGVAPQPRRGRRRWCSTSTARCTRSTRRTRRRQRPTTRAATGSTPSTASPTPRGRPFPCACGRATPGPTTSPITSRCSTPPSPDCRPRSPSATEAVTTPASCVGRSRSAPTRRAAMPAARNATP